MYKAVKDYVIASSHVSLVPFVKPNVSETSRPVCKDETNKVIKQLVTKKTGKQKL